MNLISFCLFGPHEHYYRGALANLRLAPDIYPGWQPVIWLEGSKAGWKTILEDYGAAVMLMPESRGLEGTFWRLLAPYLEGAERILFRDTDSRLNPPRSRRGRRMGGQRQRIPRHARPPVPPAKPPHPRRHVGSQSLRSLSSQRSHRILAPPH